MIDRKVYLKEEMMMKLVFGEKMNNLDYETRKGVYAVIFNSEVDKVMTVRNGKGHHFLPGGGIENNENHFECLEREVIEETGYKVCIGAYIGNAMRYFQSMKGEPLLNDGYFYLAAVSNKIQEPIEEDHFVERIDIEKAKLLLLHDHH